VNILNRATAGPPAALLAAAAGLLALVILAPALLATGNGSASRVRPALADAPPGLVPLAFQAGAATGIDGNVLLAIAKVESDWGRARQAQPDELVPADVRASIDATALQPGGATAQLLGLPDGRRVGDWINPQPVGAEHATGFVQFLPSTWRTEAAAAPGSPRDPYRPLDAMTVAGSYLWRIELGAAGGAQLDLRGALAVYGGSTAYADQVLALAQPAVTASNLPVVLPIPAPGWVQRIVTPAWPADLAAHMSPSAVTNQCVAGALATWALMHVGDPRWNPRPRCSGTRSTSTPRRSPMALRCPASRRPARWWCTAARTGRSGIMLRSGLCCATLGEADWTRSRAQDRAGARNIIRTPANDLGTSCSG
jgi:hypothetical protein